VRCRASFLPRAELVRRYAAIRLVKKLVPGRGRERAKSDKNGACEIIHCVLLNDMVGSIRFV
jgi:hypothetical protein